MPYSCYPGIKKDALYYYFFNDIVEHDHFDSYFSDNDWFNSHYDDDECVADFTIAPDSITLKGVSTFTTTCVSGPCLDIAKRYGHHHYNHHHFPNYHE